ncbi:hypothetical protein Enr10x_21080 [Gimesia panareensis]|uniref:Uncharacterized protein n=1 Tax=Gimesia panareensis TaxID=2527978 RepID=A0A517Q588_9PLAN|nr:hypothetical protein [Gimesia panareensis]QDT26798.1 hypothetical protein Enr10x_21080 [Gimesia panareensis]
MPTHKINQDWQAGNESLSKQITITADGEANIEVAVADGSTDLAINIAIDYSALQLLFIVADQDLTIETNDGSTPDDTLTLKAGKPIVWYDGCGYSNPLSADVTALYATNASGTDATLTVKTLQDATP